MNEYFQLMNTKIKQKKYQVALVYAKLSECCTPGRTVILQYDSFIILRDV